MQGKQAIRSALQVSHDWMTLLAADLADAPTKAAIPGGNHAHWILGHAAAAEWGLLGMMTGEPGPHPEMQALFGGGTQPRPDAAGYPPYAEVVERFKEARRRTLELVERLDDAQLDQKPRSVPTPFADFEAFTSVGRLLVFMAIHQASHFGQLADIRKALGRKPLMG